jgi:hypothetical protein
MSSSSSPRPTSLKRGLSFHLSLKDLDFIKRRLNYTAVVIFVMVAIICFAGVNLISYIMFERESWCCGDAWPCKHPKLKSTRWSSSFFINRSRANPFQSGAVIPG